MNNAEISWMGYERKNGKKGIRNRVLVIYTVKCAEHVARKIVEEVNHPDVELLGFDGCTDNQYAVNLATVYKGNIIKNLIMDCQSYTKYRPNETTGGIFVSWRRKEELPTGA